MIVTVERRGKKRMKRRKERGEKEEGRVEGKGGKERKAE